jgi:hypothetical protein
MAGIRRNMGKTVGAVHADEYEKDSLVLDYECTDDCVLFVGDDSHDPASDVAQGYFEVRDV